MSGKDPPTLTVRKNAVFRSRRRNSEISTFITFAALKYFTAFFLPVKVKPPAAVAAVLSSSVFSARKSRNIILVLFFEENGSHLFISQIMYNVAKKYLLQFNSIYGNLYLYMKILFAT